MSNNNCWRMNLFKNEKWARPFERRRRQIGCQHQFKNKHTQYTTSSLSGYLAVTIWSAINMKTNGNADGARILGSLTFVFLFWVNSVILALHFAGFWIKINDFWLNLFFWFHFVCRKLWAKFILNIDWISHCFHR